MSDSEQLRLAPRAYNNQHLFSDHYLNKNLPLRPQWQWLQEQAKPVMEEVTAIFRRFTPSDNERQTEENLVIPVLKLLGHTFELDASLHTSEGTNAPDYVFYRDASTRDANKNRVLTDTLPHEGGFAVGDAKFWSRPLDVVIRQPRGDALSNKNPSYQIYYYILHSGVAWGILTNGKKWRLYHRETAHKLDHFYEVDLEDLVRSGDIAGFLYFYAFFRRVAFDDGPLSVVDILRESLDYARSVGESLKEQVFDALRHVAQGFLDYTPNGLTADSETLKAIYDNSLILLYRLIFILYAEARGLLPIRESEHYRDSYSLHAIKGDVARNLGTRRFLLPGTAVLWPRLQQLFEAINIGSPPLSVASFNGGLFDPRKHDFLSKHAVGDGHLQKAIDKLARVDGAFVDYRDLSVRHMGTIYEGLLEYRLQPLPSREEGWGIELVDDKGKRKATGSYYTPDSVVNYMVEQAVEPALERALEGAASDEDKVRAALSVNILDPAMGSGHFLVEATEYIARFLVNLGVTEDGKTQEETNLAYWRRRVVQSCIYGVDLNPLAVELAKLSLWLTTVAKDRPLSFLDHHLRPGNSLVGGGLDNLELGTVASRRSGAGREAEDIEATGHLSLFTDSDFTHKMRTAVGSMWLIEGSEAASVEQVKEQERLYEQLRAQLIGKYARILNLVTATQFGLEMDVQRRRDLMSYLTSRNGVTIAAFEELLGRADAIAESEHFFHWELEFPEVYFDDHGRRLGDEGGFEVVIGNPPYLRGEQLSPYKPYFQEHFPEVYHGVADVFVYFFARGLQQAKRGGLLSYISSNSWLRANYATPLRHYLRTATTVEQIIDLGDNRVFVGAPDVYPSIQSVRRAEPPGEHIAQTTTFGRREDISLFAEGLDERLRPVSIHSQDDRGWQLHSDASRTLLAKLVSGGRSLGEVLDGRIYYGVKTGLNEAFIIDRAMREQLVGQDATCEVVLKPIFRGEDLRPWYQEDEGRWVIAIPCGWTRATLGDGLSEQDAWLRLSRRHPGIAAHLLPFVKAGQARCDKGEYWWELRPCNYYAAFEKTKIVWPDIAKLPRFSWDDGGCYLGNTAYFAATDQAWLLGYLSSRCVWFMILRSSIALGERAGMNRYRLFDQYMRPLPVRVPAPQEQEAMASVAMRITAQARERYTLHRYVRHRLQWDLATPGTKLNQKLTAWWELDFSGLRGELKKALKTDIPVRERGQWEAWFAEQRQAHERLTGEIVNLETELNDRVYALFDLTPDEIRLIEESTKYRYGEV